MVNDGDRRLALEPNARLCIIDNERQGPVAARIRGIQAARGTIISFLDDDDWWLHPTFLAEAQTMLANGDGLMFSDGVFVFDSGAPDMLFARRTTAQSLKQDNTILISSVCYPRALHDALGPFDMALPFYWDWDWYLRVARQGGALLHMAKPMVAIAVHAENMSGLHHAAERRSNLDALATKHGLGHIALKNHLSLALEAGAAAAPRR